jgi:hypothetical protein
MISLPSSLSPWARQLNAFPVELGLALGPLVQRLAGAIQPLHLDDIASADDPDGFDGLLNRGSYDRLISSDWLLADEVPEEFNRRAAMHEHLFLKIARREPAHGIGSLALFDSGPDQIGSPRLAHLAVLVVLLRRAELARANFAWGILQNPEMVLLNGSSESEIVELLRARSYMATTANHVEAWLHRTVELNSPEEIWLVGGRELERIRTTPPVSRILVEDVLDLGVRRVSVQVHSLKRRPRGVNLDLPENGACARLLRDPYLLAAATPQKRPTLIPSSGLVFAYGSRRVFGKSQNTLLSFPVPNKPSDSPGRVKQHTVGGVGQVVAVNRFGNSTVVVSAEELSLRITYIGKESHPVEGNYFLRLDEFVRDKEETNGFLFPCMRPPSPSGAQLSLLVLDQAGNLFRLESVGDERVALLEARNVIAFSSVGGIPTYIAVNETGSAVELVSLGKETRKEVLQVGTNPARRAFFGFGANAQPPCGLFALELDPLRWAIFVTKGKRHELRTEATQEVVGVIQEASYAEALVTLREDRHVVTLKGVDWERTLFESPEPVSHVMVSQGKPFIAYSTSKGDLSVHSLTHSRSLCHFTNWGTNG